MTSLLSDNGTLHLLLSFLLLFTLCVTSSSDFSVSSFPVPDWRPAAHVYMPATPDKRDVVEYMPRPRTNMTRPHPGRRYSELLKLELVQSATTWIHIRWQLLNRTGASVGPPRFSRVTCDLGNLTVLERNLSGPTAQFRIPNLSSNTRYLVCVGTKTAESYPHYRCAPFRTIPLVRPDSVLGLLLSLGYIALMSLIGYITWCMRMRRHGSTRGDEVELSCRTSTIRCSEIEERVQLNSHPAPASAPANNSGLL